DVNDRIERSATVETGDPPARWRLLVLPGGDITRTLKVAEGELHPFTGAADPGVVRPIRSERAGRGIFGGQGDGEQRGILFGRQLPVHISVSGPNKVPAGRLELARTRVDVQEHIGRSIDDV